MPGGSYQFLSQPGVRDLDARVMMHYYATGITPAMVLKMVGVGSQYAAATTDSAGKALDGSKNYKIRLPPNTRMRYDGVPNWPPAWTVMGPGHRVLRGELGVLADATNGIGSNICFVVIEVEAEKYLGALLFDDRAFCQEFLFLLQNNIGHSIREIRDLEFHSGEIRKR
jgi:hypothetical protein